MTGRVAGALLGRGNRELTARPGRRRAGASMPFALLVLGLLVGGLALLLVLNTASAANELRRHSLATKDVAVAARVQELANQVAASAAPANLAAAAAQYGMVPADDPAFLVVEPDGTVRVLGDPGPATAPPLALPTKPKSTKSPAATSTSSPATSSSATSSSAKSSAAKSSARSSAAKSGSKSATSTSSTSSSARVKPTPTPKSKPTPTPTPTVTLPGGDR